jgi:hypothetical protein
MGRSRNTALILVSQNAGDLLTEQVTNCISSVFAFRSSERVEVANVMALLGVEASPEHQAVLRGLGNGECIFRDLEGRAGRIAIDLISEEMQRWLDTNPTRARPGEPGPGATAATAARHARTEPGQGDGTPTGPQSTGDASGPPAAAAGQIPPPAGHARESQPLGGGVPGARPPGDPARETQAAPGELRRYKPLPGGPPH